MNFNKWENWCWWIVVKGTLGAKSKISPGDGVVLEDKN
jgi:hypothetical protein